MTILLTGANGFLGAKIKGALGDSVECIGRNRGSIVCDLSRKIPEIPNTVELVVHSAGLAHVPKTDRHMEKAFFDTNVGGTRNLLSAIDRISKKPAAFVYVSSVAVYGCTRGENIDEGAPLRGRTAYAQSKIAAEEIVKDWGEAEGVKVAILRLPLVVGSSAKGNLRRMITGLESGRYLGIGDGSARKSMVLASDVARIIGKAAQVGGTYNLTDGYHPSMAEFEAHLCRLLGRKPPFRISKYGARWLGRLGDLFGASAPINSELVDQLSSTLTFSDKRSRDALNWSPVSVLTDKSVIELDGHQRER